MAAFITSTVGANAAVTHASGDAQFAAGTVGFGTSGTEWNYVQANGAVGVNDFVAMDENFQAAPLTNTTGATSQKIGCAQVAFADNEWGWVATRGSDISGNMLVSVLPDAQLWTSASAGHLEDASVSAGNLEVDGVVAVTTASGSAKAVEVIMTYPTIDEGT